MNLTAKVGGMQFLASSMDLMTSDVSWRGGDKGFNNTEKRCQKKKKGKGFDVIYHLSHQKINKITLSAGVACQRDEETKLSIFIENSVFFGTKSAAQIATYLNVEELSDGTLDLGAGVSVGHDLERSALVFLFLGKNVKSTVITSRASLRFEKYQ